MPGKRVRMLFIGNSFTTKNDLPTLLSAIAKAGKGITIESQIISAGGASLRRHWNAGAASRITSAKWDYVVFQEQSTLPVKNFNRFHENVREFVPAMKESGAKMVLFMTWARKKEPENQSLLTDSYNQIGKELGASVVPVGTAWQKLVAKHDKPVLHAEDGRKKVRDHLGRCQVFGKPLRGEFSYEIVEPVRGVEPLTCGLRNRCSTTELHRPGWGY